MFQGRIKPDTQVGILLPQARYLDEQLPNHVLQRLDVVRQGAVRLQGGGIHSGFNTACLAR